MAKFEKATLLIVDPPRNWNEAPSLSSVESQARSSRGGSKEIPFMFNPEKYTIAKSSKWSPPKNDKKLSAALSEYTGSESANVDLEMLIDNTDDATASPKVTDVVDRLLSLVKPTDETVRSNKPSPPWVVFMWGSRVGLVGVAEKVSATYELFASDGTPTRARCTVTLKEMPTNPPPKQNPTSGTLAPERSHHVVAGDTLASIAFREYGDAALWRPLADANGIDDPMRLPPGTHVLLPAAGELPEPAETAT